MEASGARFLSVFDCLLPAAGLLSGEASIHTTGEGCHAQQNNEPCQHAKACFLRHLAGNVTGAIGPCRSFYNLLT